MNIKKLTLIILAIGVYNHNLSAETLREEDSHSPWLLVPIVSSDPKIGSSVGGMAAYLHQFDKNSPISTLGTSASYSSTDSYTLVAFMKAYFDADKQRLTGALIYGEINNDYSDFLGSGIPVQTTDEINLGALRYYHSIGNN